ncbi:efflux RND transporter periplasmic adaptor subunit [Desulfolithobacter sp.]
MLNIRVSCMVLFAVIVWTVNSVSQAGTNERETAVTIAQVIRGTVVISEESMGWIEAESSPVVAAEVAGKIENIFADTGQAVRAGTLLASIDNTRQKLEVKALKAEIGRLKALIRNQERTVERYRNLLAKNSISQERVDNALVQLAALRKQLEAANARLADSRRRLDKTSVVAPMDGIIEKRLVSAGDFVDTGTPLYRMVANQKLRIVLPFPENVAARLTVGQQVTLTSPLTPGRMVEAGIDQIRPTVTPQNRAVETIIHIDNPGGWLPGGTVNGRVVIDRHEHALLVPARAVVRRPAGEVVYQVVDNAVREIQVTTGQHQGDLVEIVSGLSGNERIAVDGAGFLANGVLVREEQVHKK